MLYEDKVVTFDSFSFKNPVMQFPVKQTWQIQNQRKEVLFASTKQNQLLKSTFTKHQKQSAQQDSKQDETLPQIIFAKVLYSNKSDKVLNVCQTRALE